MRRIVKRPGSGAPSVVDTPVQNFPSAPLIPLPSQNFEGNSNTNAVLPPDTNGDVGPNHYVQWVNLSFAVWSKGTATTPPQLLYGPAAANTLWRGFGGPCETRNDGDPVVMYDHLADRWFMSQLAIPNNYLGFLFAPFYECIAVSATPDPTGPYYRYQFSFNKLNDYPKFGLWPDGYYMAINQYSPFYLSYAGQGVAVFDRDRMLSGQPASMVYFDLASVDMNLGGMLPSHLIGPPPPAGSPNYYVQVDDDAWGYSPDQLQIAKFHVDWANPSSSTFSTPVRLPVAPFESDLCAAEPCVPQPATTARLDPLSDRLMYRLQYRNFGAHESLVVNHTVDVDGSDHAGIRWYEIQSPSNAPIIYQQGTYAPDADHRWMGSLAMDRVGNMALGFSVSGATTFPSIRYTGRLVSDPPGIMTQGEADVIVGSGSQLHSPGRWGDYSLLAVDPVDQCTFWYTQEYLASTSDAGWQTRVASFAFPSCTGSEEQVGPRVSIAATTATATEAGSTSGAFTVTRTGDLTSPLEVHYAASGTATPGVDYVALPGSITLAPGEATATIPVTPIDDPLVEPNETVAVTLTWDSAYLVSAPSGGTVTIVSDDVPPDLVVSAVGGPTVAGAGTTITITDTTKNQGGGPAVPSTTTFYLSTNAVLDAPDQALASRDVAALAAGASNSGSTFVTIPAGTVTGTYYIVVKADANNTNTETQETNNTRPSGVIRIGPDLAIPSLSVPAAAAPGDTISVSDTTLNQGGGDAGPSRTGFYLSTNGAISGATPLGGRDVGALAAGISSSTSTYLVIPSDKPAGLYYLVASADQNNAVVESQEANNVRSSAAIRIGPDLYVSSVTVSGPTAAGGTVTVTDTTKNQGAASAPASSTAFYLSTNTALDAPDQLLASRDVPALPPGASSVASTLLQIPGNTATGTYFILAKADGNNAVPESFETNNVSLVQLKVGPDLTLTISVSGSPVAAGGSITITDTTKNAGAGNAGASTTRFYLSTNATYEATDTFLGSRDVPPLPGGGTTNGGTTICVIPTGTAAGTYYVIGVADSANAVTETTETNNNAVTIVRIS